MSIRLLLQAATYADQPIRQKYHFHNSYELILSVKVRSVLRSSKSSTS